MSEPTLEDLKREYEEALRYVPDEYDDPVPDAAAAYIKGLVARIEKLETALLPFAVRYPTEHMDLMPDLDKWTPVYQWVDKPSELLPGTPVIYIGEFRAVNAVYPYTPSWRKPDDADDDRRE